LVCSFQRVQTIEGGTSGAHLRERYFNLTENLSTWCKAEKYVVGHIKLHLAMGDAQLWLSNTGRETSVRMSPGWDKKSIDAYNLGFTAIAIGGDEARLIAKIKELTGIADSLTGMDDPIQDSGAATSPNI